MSWNRFRYAPYVPVGQKLAKGQKAALALAKKEKRSPQPVKPQGREIARNFWGKAWCDHLGSMRDLENRLDRGKTYLRNGSVVDLVITPCTVRSLVAGSSTYTVTIHVKPLSRPAWERIKKDARNSVRSVVDLLAGKLDESLIRQLTNAETGIFPKSEEIAFSCSCPDGAYVCKHVAAAFYGVGTLLDSKPELLFLIRDVDSSELVGLEAVASSLEETLKVASSLGNLNLEAMFDIELEKEPSTPTAPALSITKPKRKPIGNGLPTAKAVKPKGSVGKSKTTKAPSATQSKAQSKDLAKAPEKTSKKTAPKSKPPSAPSKVGKSKSAIQKAATKPKKVLTKKPKDTPKPIKRSKKSEK